MSCAVVNLVLAVALKLDLNLSNNCVVDIICDGILFHHFMISYINIYEYLTENCFVITVKILTNLKYFKASLKTFLLLPRYSQIKTLTQDSLRCDKFDEVTAKAVL